MDIRVSRLKLLSPLFYTPDEGLKDAFLPLEEGEGELLFCFELEEANYRSFEPDKGIFFEKMIFAGRAVKMLSCGPLPAAVQIGGKELSVGQFQLAAGNYLFSQERRLLTKEEAAALALEIQAEGLWQRLNLGRKLYLRRLFEDGSQVTQIFRPREE